MNDVDLSVFDKLLLEAVFQNEKECQNKESTKEFIQHCTARCLQEKQRILELQNNINSIDATIQDLQNYNPEKSERVTMCTSTSTVLSREEALLRSQLESAKQATENDKKTYQDSASKYKEVFRQHQEQYIEFTVAKKYHSIKDELDDIQNSILKHEEQRMTKEKTIADVLGPASFVCYKDWCLQLANMKKSTNKSLEDVSELSCTSLELIPKVNELEQKLKYVNENIENLAKQTNSKTNNQTMTFPHRTFSEGRKNLNKSNEPWPILRLSNFPQKIVQAQRDIKLSQTNKIAAREENENSSSVDQCMEEDSLVSSLKGPLTNDKHENRGSPTNKVNQQVQLRLALPEKQILQKMDISETESRKEQAATLPDTSKDSGYCSQVDSGSYEEMDYQSSDKGSQNEVFALPNTPSCFTIPKIPAPAKNKFVKKVQFTKSKKGQRSTKSSPKSYSAVMEQSETSPYFNMIKTSTPKTPNLGIFESPFGSKKIADQHGSYSPMDSNISSPAKDFGSVFGSMEGDDDFAFSFTSKPSQSADENKGDFGFMLPFEQDIRPSKEFEPSQTNFKFTFF